MRAEHTLIAAFAACAMPMGSMADIPRQSGLSMYVARMAATALPRAGETGWQEYRTISRLAEVLLNETRYGAEIAAGPSDTLTGHPHLVLTDEDGDARADFYAYYDSPDAPSTQAFGVYFTRAHDPQPAWLVINRGPATGQTPDGKPAVFWSTRQFVDRNADGRFDLAIANGAEAGGDGPPVAEATAWLFDDDFDGRIDRAERNIAGRVEALTPSGGVYDLGGAIGTIDPAAAPFAAADAIAADIVLAAREVRP